MIIDSHTHVFRPDFVAQRERLLEACPWFSSLYNDPKSRMATVDDLLAGMARSGVDKAVILGFAWQDNGRMSATNDYLVESAEKSNGRLLPFILVNPTDVDFTEREIDRFKDRKIMGIGELMPDGQGYHLTKDNVMDGVMRLAEEHDLIVMIHTNEPVGHAYPGKGHVFPSIMCRMVDKFPGVRIICSHWGGGLIFYEMMPEVSALLKNVYYDSAASTLLYDDQVFDIAVQIAPKKILFGSDFNLIGQKQIISRARKALAHAPEALDDFLGENARRLFAV